MSDQSLEPWELAVAELEAWWQGSDGEPIKDVGEWRSVLNEAARRLVAQRQRTAALEKIVVNVKKAIERIENAACDGGWWCTGLIEEALGDE